MGKRKSPSKDNEKKCKRPPTAYSLFVKSKWEKDEKKENFLLFTKTCSGLWARMTDDDKQRYKDEAATLKEKWDGEHPQMKKSDPKKKRAPGPYIIFCSEMREKLKKENPDFSMLQISKELGRLWKTLTDGEKAKYHKKASEEKERYKEEEKRSSVENTEKPASEENTEKLASEENTEKPASKENVTKPVVEEKKEKPVEVKKEKPKKNKGKTDKAAST